MQTTKNKTRIERLEKVAEPDSRFALKIARTTLGYLAMDDELMKRMELASGEIRVLRSGSDATIISKENKMQVHDFEMAFRALKDSTTEPRELEILAEMLVDVCVDIICDCKM